MPRPHLNKACTTACCLLACPSSPPQASSRFSRVRPDPYRVRPCSVAGPRQAGARVFAPESIVNIETSFLSQKGGHGLKTVLPACPCLLSLSLSLSLSCRRWSKKRSEPFKNSGWPGWRCSLDRPPSPPTRLALRGFTACAKSWTQRYGCTRAGRSPTRTTMPTRSVLRARVLAAGWLVAPPTLVRLWCILAWMAFVFLVCRVPPATS